MPLLLTRHRWTLRHCFLLWLIGGGVFVKSLHDRLGDVDIWFHIKTGEYILLHGAVPHHGIFSYTAADRPWVVHQWLAAVIFHLVFKAGGCLGLLLLRSVLLAIIFGFLFWISWVRSRSFYLSLYVTVLGIFGTLEFWGERGYLWMYLCFLMYLYALWACRRACLASPRPKPFRFLWPLPLLMLFWVNTHGAYPLGFALMAAYGIGDWLEERFRPGQPASPFPEGHCHFRRALLAIAIPTALAVPLNPNGLQITRFVFQLLQTSTITDWIQEWQPTDFHDLVLYLPFAILLASFLLAFRRKTFGWPELLICAAMFHLALSAIRHIPLLYFAVCPMIAEAFPTREEWMRKFPALSRSFSASSQSESALLNWTALLLFVVLLFILAPKGTGFRDCARPDAYPIAAADYIERHRIPAPILNDDGWGGYLMWRFGETRPVFHDTRAELYGEDLGMEFIRTRFLMPGWKRIFEKYPIKAVLWKPKDPLVEALAYLPGWEKVYSDKVAVIYLRREAAEKGRP